MVQDVHEENDVEIPVFKGNLATIENLHRDVRLLARKHIDSADGHIGPLRRDHTREQAAPGSHIQNTGVFRG